MIALLQARPTKFYNYTQFTHQTILILAHFIIKMGGCMTGKTYDPYLSGQASYPYPYYSSQANYQYPYNSGQATNPYIVAQTSSSNLSVHCRIYGCTERHQKHYCRVCQNKDSDHYAKDCPESIVAYHGTSSNVLAAIKTEGFKPSETGNLGKGVYFTNDQVVAQQISHNRAGMRNAQPVVFQCRIPKNLAVTQYGQHGKWQKVTENSFAEFAVKDPNRIKVLNVQHV